MALEEINKDAISFKRLSGKAHTQFGFDVTEEGISSNIQIALTTVFGQEVNSNPATAGLTTLGSTDGIVERIRFEIDTIPDTVIGTNQSQGYRLKLPAGYTGVLSADFPAGTYLYQALGKLQIVPSLYGELKPDGSTQYDPVLYDTNLNVIPKFDPINWQLDSYSGVLFVQDPPSAYDTLPSRPRFLDAYLYVGQYLDKAITGASASALSAGRGINQTDFNNDTVSVDLSGYTAPSNINITITGGSQFIVDDNSGNGFGIQYAANYNTTFQPRSLVDKQYVDNIAGGLTLLEAVDVATTSGIIFGAVSSIDGITLVEGYRVLVKNQADPDENGIYLVNSGGTIDVTDRALDANDNGELVKGSFTSVISGNTNQATIWVVSSDNPIDIGSTPIFWTQLALPIVYIGGVGIDINGTTIDLDGENLAGLGIAWNAADQRFDLDFSINKVGSGEDIFKQFDAFRNVELKSIVAGSGVTITTTADEIIINATGGTGSEFIGLPDDGTYTDGLFSYWTSGGTKISNAFDDINEFLLSLAPPFAPELDAIDSISSFVSGNLSFGATNGISNYTNVGGAPIGVSVDVNGFYGSSGNRYGIINNAVTGVLNYDVVGDPSGIPFENDAFNNGDEGSIVLELNGSIISSLDLTTGSGILSNAQIAVSEIKFSKFSTGAEFNQAPYRTGTYNIPTVAMDNGWNYLRVIHSGTSAGSIQTNYIEWVYDPDTNNISGGAGVIDNISLSGSREVSGVEYYTNGTVDYNVIISNAYRNVYSNSNAAIQFVNTTNLSPDISSFGMNVVGSGIVNSTGQIDGRLPILDTLITNAEVTDIDIDATLEINSNRVLGSQGSLGKVETSITVLHPFTGKRYNSGSLAVETGFLIYNIPDSSNNQNENFTGEANRMQDVDYSSLSYNQVNGTGFNWSSSQDLISGNAQHNTGMLVFDGSLYYPSSSELDNFGIFSGDFSSFSVDKAPAGNPNYSTAAGERLYYRKFKQDLAQSLGELTFTITHLGNESTFSTVGSTLNPTPSGNGIVFEFFVIRTNNSKYGYGNPFAQFNNPSGLQNTSTSHSGNVTTVNVNLGANRTDNNDIIIVRMKFAQGYAQSVSNVAITNI